MKKYNNQQLREILEKQIMTPDLRHKHYKRTCELAEYYKQLMTGECQDALIVSYKQRENDEQKKQRIAITNTRTQYVSNKVLSVFKRVPRSDNVVDNFYYENDKGNDDKIKEISERQMKFHNGETLKDYLTEAFEHYIFYDPNAWLITELLLDPDKKKKPFVYPLEVPSSQAINYEWHGGELQYLIVLQSADVYERKEKGNQESGIIPEAKEVIARHMKGIVRKGDRYLLYAADHAIEYIEIADLDKKIDDSLYAGSEIVVLSVGNAKKRYAARFFETKSKVCPAKQFGYIKDPETQRKTYVSPIHPADKVYRDLINTKSEYDLAKALHGFLQKIQYATVCDYERDYEKNKDRCLSGHMSLSNETCPACNGLGLKVHTTVQDVVYVKWPEGKDEFVPLDRAVHYVELPEHIMKMWKQEVQDLERDVSFAIFNTNLFDRSEIAVTATEKRLNTEAAYDVLFDYGCQYSAFVKFILEMIAIHTQNDEGFVVDHRISGFQLDTVIDLLAQRRLAVDAGSPYTIIQAIDMQILTKQAQDNPTNIEWIKVREKFRPFREKSKEEKMFILADLAADDPKKVLYVNFEDIMDQIEEEHGEKPFFAMKPDAQRKIVSQKVQNIIAAMPKQTEQQLPLLSRQPIARTENAPA